MTKLEELEMKLSKHEAIKQNLNNRQEKLKKSSIENSKENNLLLEKIKYFKKEKRYSELSIIIVFFISLFGINLLLDLNLLFFGEELIKILLLSIPILNTMIEIKEIKRKNNYLNSLNKRYSIVSQYLFADQLFLKNTKEDIIDNDKIIALLNEQIKNINYTNNNKEQDNGIEVLKEKKLIKK